MDESALEGATAVQKAARTDQSGWSPADFWQDELDRLEPSLRSTCLKLNWAAGDDAWTQLRTEWERIRRIKTDVAWLASEAAQRIESKLLDVGALIDAGEASNSRDKLSKAALGLSEAEGMIQRAWLSRWYNRWHIRMPPIPAAWQPIAVLLIAALALTTYLILKYDLHPRGTTMQPYDAFYGATLWGLGGGLILALKTLHERVQRQEFEIQRLAWYVLSPLLGFTFGAIACLVFLAGLLTTGQAGAEATSQAAVQATAQGDVAASQLLLDPTPILLLALMAGFAQNSFIDFFSNTAGRAFPGRRREEA